MGTSLSWRVMPDKNSGLSKLNYFLQVLSWNYRQMRQIYMSDLMEMNFHIECVLVYHGLILMTIEKRCCVVKNI